MTNHSQIPQELQELARKVGVTPRPRPLDLEEMRSGLAEISARLNAAPVSDYFPAELNQALEAHTTASHPVPLDRTDLESLLEQLQQLPEDFSDALFVLNQIKRELWQHLQLALKSPTAFPASVREVKSPEAGEREGLIQGMRAALQWALICLVTWPSQT